MIYRMKIAAVLLTITVAACLNSKPARYSITNSKAYEASLFRQNCAICHGPEGEGKTLGDGRVIPNIRDGEHKYKTDEEIYNHIANGGNGKGDDRHEPIHFVTGCDVIKPLDHEKRREKNSKDRDFIGGGHCPAPKSWEGLRIVNNSPPAV